MIYAVCNGLLLGYLQSFEWLALISFLPMAAQLHVMDYEASYRQRCAAIFMFALAYLLGAVYWIALGIHRPPANGLLDTAIVWSFILIYLATLHTIVFWLFLLIGVMCSVSQRQLSTFALCLSWPFAEMLRSTGAFAMPWGLLGYSQINNPVLIGLYPVIGAIGVSGMMWLLAAWVASTYVLLVKWKIAHKERFHHGQLKWGWGWFIGVVFMASLASQTIEWTQAKGTFLDIRIVHTHWPDEEKHTAAVRLLSLKDLRQASGSKEHVDISIYPELYLTMAAADIPQEIRAGIEKLQRPITLD
jgi:apolipoprotein N-acyltransferase